jgi:acyl transferase domain-containing protein
LFLVWCISKPNPNIDFANSPFFVASAAIPWPRGEVVRRAGVNVVGLGGTNVHFVLEEAPELAPSGPSRAVHLLLLSAKTLHSLDELSAKLGAHLQAHPELNLADVAYTLQTGRQRLEFRKAILCSDQAQAIAALSTGDASRVLSSHLRGTRKRSVVFMFPGVGDHYPDMAAGLYRSEPVFRDEVQRCCTLLQPILGLDLREVLFSTAALQGERRPGFDLKAMLNRGSQVADRLQQTSLAQPAVFVIEYCLARLLMSWGVRPQAVIGYSLGEFVAATVAGSLKLEDALRVVALRARLIDSLPAGAMLQDAWREICELPSTQEWAGPRIPYPRTRRHPIDKQRRLLWTLAEQICLHGPALWRIAIGELLKEKERVLLEVGRPESGDPFVKQHPDYDMRTPCR